MANKKQLKKIIEGLKKGLSLTEISEKVLKTSYTASLNRIISENSIDPSEYNDAYLFMNKEWLSSKLEEFGSPWQIAKTYNMSRTSITRYAKKFGLYESKFSRQPKNEIDEEYFDVIDSSRKAYWLGFFMADSTIYEYENGRMQFELKIQRKDRQLLEDLARDINFPIDKIKDRDSMRFESVTHASCLRTYNKHFCETLIKYGIVPRRTDKKDFISDLIPSKFLVDFVRGFWDGDGSVLKSKISVTCASSIIIDKLHHYFSVNNIKSSISVYSCEGKMNLYTLRIKADSKMNFLDFIYYDDCFGLARKINSAKNLKSTLLSKVKVGELRGTL